MSSGVCLCGHIIAVSGQVIACRRGLASRTGRNDRDGVDGRSLNIRGVCDVNAKYAKPDVVMLGGEALRATRDNPGVCPGEG